MVDVAEEGLGTIANSIANQNMFGYDDEVPGYEYNVEKALELMKEAGYEDGFDIGTIYCREGKDENVAEIARENLAAIGITATVTPARDQCLPGRHEERQLHHRCHPPEPQHRRRSDLRGQQHPWLRSLQRP